MGAEKPILAIFGTKTSHSGTKLCPYELIFHAYNKENFIDTLFFFLIKKNHLNQVKLIKLRVKFFAFKIELYCKVNTLNFKISIN